MRLEPLRRPRRCDIRYGGEGGLCDLVRPSSCERLDPSRKNYFKGDTYAPRRGMKLGTGRVWLFVSWDKYVDIHNIQYAG